MLPNVDIEAALASAHDATPTAPSTISISQSETLLSPSSEVESGLETIPDTAPSGAQGYDWTEETSLDHLADGMAALRVEPTGAGYLGRFFGNCLLCQI